MTRIACPYDIKFISCIEVSETFLSNVEICSFPNEVFRFSSDPKSSWREILKEWPYTPT